MTLSQEMTKQEFESLLTKHKASPNDINLIIQMAFELLYAHNDELIGYQEPLDYFKLAYQTATIEEDKIITAHNYAGLLYSEHGEDDKAIEIEQECIALNPSYNKPYDLMALMLLEKKDYKESVKYAQIAIESSQLNGVDNKQSTFNLGTGYYYLGQYQEAIEIFSNIDSELSLYNLALCYVQINDKNKLINTVHTIESKDFESLDELDIANLYVHVADYTTAVVYIKKFIKRHGFAFCLLSYLDITYAIWKVDKALFYEVVEKIIKDNQGYINEIKNNPNDLKDKYEPYGEKYYLELYHQTIKNHQNIEQQFQKTFTLSDIEPRYIWSVEWLGIKF